jgi:DNA repair and recombination RAD54-like protein
MADHAIVLYDPTIDDKPEPDPTSIEANLSPEELVKREEEEKIRRQKEDREKNGPHKSLKVILGLDKVVKKEDVKVPVVIDPRLTAKLRPHQVEGVKVSDFREFVFARLDPDGQFDLYSSCTGARPD